MRTRAGLTAMVCAAGLTSVVYGQGPTGQVPPSVGASRPRPSTPDARALSDDARKGRCDDLKALMEALNADGAESPMRQREIADYQRMREQLSCPSETAKTAPALGRPNWEGTWELINGDPYNGEFAGRPEATLVLHRSTPGAVLSQAGAEPFKAWQLTCPTGPGGFDAYEGTLFIKPGGVAARYGAFWTTTDEGKKGGRVLACTGFAGTTETLLEAVFWQHGTGYNSGAFNLVVRTGESGQYGGEQYDVSGIANIGHWYGRRAKQ